jgi:hypothetical protein
VFWVRGLSVVLLSTICTVKVKVPDTFGLPVMTPSCRRRCRSVGRLPEMVSHLYGGSLRWLGVRHVPHLRHASRYRGGGNRQLH